MKRTWTTIATMLAAGLAAAAPDAGEPVMEPEDFAAAWELDVASGGFHRVALPLDVYAAAHASDLADVRVLDARGRPVPRFVHRPSPEDGAPPAPRTIDVFPIHESDDPAQVFARVTLDTGGARAGQVSVVASVDSAHVAAERAAPALVSPVNVRHWVAVLPDAPVEAKTLRINWFPAEQSFVGSAVLETSDDLSYWREVGRSAMAALISPQARVERGEIELHGALGRYLRLTPLGQPADFRVSGFTLEFAAPHGEAVRDWHAATLDGSGAPHEIDLGAAVPVDRFDMVASGGAGATHVALYSRATPDEPWARRDQALFYRLDAAQGGLASAPASLVPVAHRYWRVEFGGGVALPGELRLGWRPAEIVFIAQGEAPFTLFAGSARHRQTDAGLAELDQGVRRLWQGNGEAAAMPATLGARETVSGDDAYAARPRDVWRRWVLWALLVAGVGFVGWMAWRVARELRTATPA